MSVAASSSPAANTAAATPPPAAFQTAAAAAGAAPATSRVARPTPAPSGGGATHSAPVNTMPYWMIQPMGESFARKNAWAANFKPRLIVEGACQPYPALGRIKGSNNLFKSSGLSVKIDRPSQGCSNTNVGQVYFRRVDSKTGKFHILMWEWYFPRDWSTFHIEDHAHDWENCFMVVPRGSSEPIVMSSILHGTQRTTYGWKPNERISNHPSVTYRPTRVLHANGLGHVMNHGVVVDGGSAHGGGFQPARDYEALSAKERTILSSGWGRGGHRLSTMFGYISDAGLNDFLYETARAVNLSRAKGHWV